MLRLLMEKWGIKAPKEPEDVTDSDGDYDMDENQELDYLESCVQKIDEHSRELIDTLEYLRQ